MSPADILGQIPAVLKLMTWKRVLPTCFLMLCLVTCYVLYANAPLIGQRVSKAIPDRVVRKVVSPPLLVELSDEMSKKVNSFTQQDNFVDMTVVFGIDQGANTRLVLYRAISDQIVLDRVTRYDALVNRDLLLPFRTADATWNEQMQSLVDGEFRCGSAQDSGLFAAYPSLKGVLKTVCRIPIPPSWSGSLAGYIAFYSVNELTQADVDKLRIKARYLSLDIFNHDVKQEPTQFDRKP